MGALSSVFVEAEAHRILKSYRVAKSRSREIYDAPLAVMVDAVEKAMREIKRTLRGGLNAPLLETPEERGARILAGGSRTDKWPKR